MTNVFRKFDKDKGKIVWRLWFILFVELLGTFAMVFEIIAPSALNLSQFEAYRLIFGTFFMKALWVTSFIWILIMICGKVSVNLNPAVTMSEAISGRFGWNRAFAMIAIQFVGALAAAEFAYQLGGLDVFGATAANPVSLDAVTPILQLPSYWFGEGYANATHVIWESSDVQSIGDWAISIIPFMLIEAIFVFTLVATVLEGKASFMKRSFIIAIPLTFTVMLGVSTENIALNPARLFGPAIIGAAHSDGGHSVNTLSFTWIYFFGEMIGVLAWKLRVNYKDEKLGMTKDSMKKQVKIMASEALVAKAKYAWVLVGNKPLEQMSKDELTYAAKFCGVEFAAKETKEDLEFDIIDWIIFDLSENEKPPLVTKKVAKKATTKKKSVTKKKTVTKKKPAQKLSKEEQAKRDAKRAAAKKKAEKLGGDLKKLKLTDLYGVGPKIEEYYHKNGVNNLLQLSKLPKTKITKKFIEELPALRSWNPKMKQDKIESNIQEAKFMVNELTKK